MQELHYHQQDSKIEEAPGQRLGGPSGPLGGYKKQIHLTAGLCSLHHMRLCNLHHIGVGFYFWDPPRRGQDWVCLSATMSACPLRCPAAHARKFSRHY